MSIFVTGDCHCPVDITKLNTKNWPEQKTLTKDDYLIVCGDMGIVWDNSSEDKYWQKWFNNKPFTTLFIDGNHENHKLLNEYPVDIWNGGKVHKIMPSVFHLMRGQIFTINGIKFFTMGGAQSHDKINRTEGVSWWREELPNAQEYNEGINNLIACEYKVDIILTHCAPSTIQETLGFRGTDSLVSYLNSIRKTTTFSHWYFGHYHIDEKLTNQYSCVYNKIHQIRLEDYNE